MTHDEKIVEAVAMAIYATPVFQPAYGPWQEGSNRAAQQHARVGARAAITAYQAEAWQPRSTDAVDALASSWACIDGKLGAYEQERGMSLREAYQSNLTGHYAGYQVEAVEMIQRLRKRGFDVVPLPNPPASP